MLIRARSILGLDCRLRGEKTATGTSAPAQMLKTENSPLKTPIHAFGSVTPRCPWYFPARSA